MQKVRCIMILFLISLPLSSSFANESTQKNRILAQRVFDEILNKGKYEIFDEMYAKDFVKHVDRNERSLTQEIQDAKAMRMASSDLVMTVDQMIADGDRVAILYTGRGTHTGPFNSLPATGKKYSVTGTTVFRFANDKIAEEWTSYNMLDILQQLGYSAFPPENNKAVARRVFTEIFNQGKFDVADQIYAQDFVNHTRTRDIGLEEDQSAARGWRQAAPDLVMTVQKVVAEGDLVTVLWTGEGTNTGAGNGLPATGKRISTRGITIWRIVDGKIKEEWTSFDRLSLMEQAGLIPATKQ